jgi:uncharacterized membrane protein
MGPAVFRRQGDFWTIAFEGRAARLRDSRGLQYLAELLRHPESEFHVTDLAALSSGAADREPARSRAPDEGARKRGDLGHAGELLDSQARAQYRERLRDLETELAETVQSVDEARGSQIRAEIDFLTAELVSAQGIGGRARRGADSAERARKAVTNRLRDAIARVAREHPSLGLHLEKTLRLGIFCCYQPAPKVEWSF